MTPLAYALTCCGLLAVTYLVNTTMISVFYHRGLAHKAVVLPKWVERVVVATGIWLTGLDPKGWVCMHRRHHAFSDADDDPHSPVQYGLLGVLFAQLKSYEKTLIGLAKRDPAYTRFVQDLDFEVNALNRRRLWMLPYVIHALIALAIALPTGLWALGACYFAGMMSHPIEGWIVNALGHAMGGRNFDTPDNSRNNHLAAWLIVGEGFQNNHHQYPASARFSYRPLEVDVGYGICRVLEGCGLLTIQRETLIPAFGETQPVAVGEAQPVPVGEATPVPAVPAETPSAPARIVHSESARFRRMAQRAARP